MCAVSDDPPDSSIDIQAELGPFQGSLEICGQRPTSFTMVEHVSGTSIRVVLRSRLLIGFDFLPASLFESTGQNVVPFTLVEHPVRRGILGPRDASKCAVLGKDDILRVPSGREVLVPVERIWLNLLAPAFNVS